MRRAVVLVALTVVFSGVLEAQSKAPSRVPPKSTSPAVTATPALPTAWRNARWGMTAAEVLAAFPGEAAQLPVAVNYSDKYRGLVGIEGYQIANVAYAVRFLFDRQERLALINITPAPRDSSTLTFNSLAQLLTEKYGQPLTNHEEKTRVSDSREKTWKTPEALIDLDYVNIRSIDRTNLVLQYRPSVSAGTDKL